MGMASDVQSHSQILLNRDSKGGGEPPPGFQDGGPTDGVEEAQWDVNKLEAARSHARWPMEGQRDTATDQERTSEWCRLCFSLAQI